MDLRLKTVLQHIRTCQKIRIEDTNYGEAFYPNYSELNCYEDYYVINIKTEEGTLIISIADTI